MGGTPESAQAPLIAHVVHGFRVGGLENGVVNLLNRIPPERYRHAILCLTGYDEAFAARIRNPAVTLHDLHKRPGRDPGLYLRMARLLGRLRPGIVHTRNLATLEMQLPALAAGVRGRVHGEHGWDVHDPRGRNRKYLLLRRVMRHVVRHYVPLSRELQEYLADPVGVPRRRITRICNGVDVQRFSPKAGAPALRAALGLPPSAVVIGTVGRLEAIKDPLNLADAFISMVREGGEGAATARLLMVGGGSLEEELRERLSGAGLQARAVVTGSREDVPDLLRAMDVFALPSRAEGISNTILEAMATGLPVVATRVGGNAELVEEGATGALVPSEDADALAAGLQRYLEDPGLRRAHAAAARARAEQEFSMDAMVASYLRVYDGLMEKFTAKAQRRKERQVI